MRFLARSLDLDETQFEAVAALFSTLKTERAQMAVDRRRAAALYSDAFGTEAFDVAKANEAAQLSASAQKTFDEALTAALGKLHEKLDERQRAKLAALLREMPGGLR